MGKYQSGQMGQTVNLLAYAFGGSNPSLPTKKTDSFITICFFISLPSIIKRQFYRTMVGTIDIRMNLGINQLIIQGSGSDEIIDTPASVLFPRLKAIRPPGVDILLMRIKVAESVCKARIEPLGELSTLLIRKTSILTVTLRILQVDFLMSHIQVATHHHRLLFFQLLEISQESISQVMR